MSTDASSWVMANPSRTEPEILLQYNQKSDFEELLAGGTIRNTLGQEDKYVYLRSLGVKTKVSSSAPVPASPSRRRTYSRVVSCALDAPLSNSGRTPE